LSFVFGRFCFLSGLMANESGKAKMTSRQSRMPLPVIILVSFGLGVGMTWLVLRNSQPRPPKPAVESFLPSTGGQAATTAQAAPVAAASPPDVSQLPPADAERTLANWNYDRQDWSHAIEHYQKAIAAGSDNPDVRTDFGNCFRFLGQPEKALEQYQLAQKQNPMHENSLFNQISLFAQYLHDNARAESVARDFILRFPLSPQAATAKQLLSQAERATATSTQPE
jgi:tetratricopeptide repeat protein